MPMEIGKNVTPNNCYQFCQMQNIIRKLQQRLKIGILEQSDNDFATASIRYKDRTVKVQLRLKGNLNDHFKAR
ncbi:uncharacterized protein METZ01_LOCUS344724 [marine metagenome]|uniref:Uncharacterized protein n=1 Tax=marine metagenome TaxID=408172 RepID=A0A382R3T0_9ZZZZ